jgi:signal transduction histidine kinase
MLRNLLDNALRHSAGVDQMPRLSMLHRVDAYSARICITVRDFGPGVAESALPHLAEPFFRPDTARDRADGGVGLGLYLCKLVAQAHGGTLAVANAHPGLEVTVMLTTELVRP